MKKKSGKIFISILLIVTLALLVAIGGSFKGRSINGIPLFGMLIGIAFLLQWVVFIPSFLNRTEKYFDLTGSISYISLSLLSLFLTGGMDTRTVLLIVLVIIWAARLGSFLFKRVQKAGEDRRFRDIKVSFWRFLRVWTLQGLWITFTIAAAFTAVTSIRRIPIGIFAVLGTLFWIIGFIFEVIADSQKKIFRSNPVNKGKFIQSGIWSWSRHPNYAGEILLWFGIALIALPVLQGWQFVTLISPVFVFVLLRWISGVPMLEKRADEKWGGNPDYERYKANTPVLFPVPPGWRKE